MSPTKAPLLALAVLTLLASPAAAQRRRGRARANAPSAPVVAPQAPELISVPVADIDNMLRQMRVWVLNPPAGASAWGLSQLGAGYRLWALLPSCRAPNPDDPRDPCPVDRVVVESIGDNAPRVNTMDPTDLTPNTQGSRRVQSFVIPSGVGRVRVKLLGPRNAVRYEAVVDVGPLRELPTAQGSASPAGFAFDLAQYPAR